MSNTKSQSKSLLIIALLIALALGGYYFFKQNQTDTSVVDNNDIIETSNSIPGRPAEINGIVRSIEGNEIVIVNEIRDPSQELTEEERQAKRAERAKLTPEERQALRESESNIIDTETLTLVIPVGTPILKSDGSATGNFLSADISDISSGTYLSIWMQSDTDIELIKIKGAN